MRTNPSTDGPRRRVPSPALMALSVAALAMVMVACGGDDDTGQPTVAPDQTPAPESTDAAQLETVRVAYPEGFGSLPVHVAQVNGFFEANGLAVEETPGADMPLWIQALDSQYDIVLSLPSISMGALVAGLDHVVVSGLARTSAEAPNIPLMTADPDIQDFGDLAGKRVGVLTIAGTIGESILYLVDHAGQDPNDVVLVPTPFPAMQDALEAGQIDAATLAMPFDTVLAQEEGYRVVGDPVVAAAEAITGQPDPLNSYFVASRDFVEKSPDVAAGFGAALEEAMDWIASNEADARLLLAEWLGIPPEIADIATLPLYSTHVTIDDFEVFYIVATNRGSLMGEPDLTDIVWEG